jgi:hypothetical protein
LAIMPYIQGRRSVLTLSEAHRAPLSRPKFDSQTFFYRSVKQVYFSTAVNQQVARIRWIRGPFSERNKINHCALGKKIQSEVVGFLHRQYSQTLHNVYIL